MRSNARKRIAGSIRHKILYAGYNRFELGRLDFYVKRRVQLFFRHPGSGVNYDTNSNISL